MLGRFVFRVAVVWLLAVIAWGVLVGALAGPMGDHPDHADLARILELALRAVILLLPVALVLYVVVERAGWDVPRSRNPGD